MPSALLAPPVDDATRRQFLGLIAAAGLLTACGTADQATVEASRRFVDATGTAVEIPDVPRRVVCLDDLMAARLLSLGGPVIAMPSVNGTFRQEFVDQFDLSAVTDLGPLTEPNVEAILALTPDLIVERGTKGTSFYDVGLRRQLEAIAPLVALENFVDLERATADAADLLGRAATVTPQALAAEFDDALADLRAVLGERWSDVTASIVLYRGASTIYTWGPTSVPPTDVLTRVGVTWAAVVDQAAAAGGDLQLSAERLGELAADLVLTSHLGHSDDEPRIDSEPTFTALPAAQAGQVIDIEGSYFGVHYPTYRDFARWLTAQLTERPALDTGLV